MKRLGDFPPEPTDVRDAQDAERQRIADLLTRGYAWRPREPRRIYVASSWRNPYQQNIVSILRHDGHDVYDFMHPPGGDHLGFSWSDVDPSWRDWTMAQYQAALDHPIADAGFASDYSAMLDADTCVLVLPCGRSAHLEAGYFVGAGKHLYILLDEAEYVAGASHSVIELMYKMADLITADIDAIRDALRP